MANTLDASGNVIVNGYSTNMSPSQYSSSYPSGGAPITISPESLQAPKPIVPVTVPPNMTGYNAISSGMFDTVTANNNNALSYYTNLQNNGESALARNRMDIQGIYDQLSGRGSDTLKANELTGVDGLQKTYDQNLADLADLGGQSSALKRQMELVNLQYDRQNAGGAITKAGSDILKGNAQLDNTLESIRLAQLSDIKTAAVTKSQIALESAQKKAALMVDLKYKDIETQLAAKKQQYDMNKDALSAIDKKRTEALGIALKKEEADLAEKKANEKAVADLIVKASPYAPAATLSIARKLQAEGKSETEVAIALGKYGGDYIGDLVKKSTIAKNNADAAQSYAAIDKTRAEIKSLQTPLPITAPVGSNANFTATLLNSAVNKESLSQTERTAVTKNLTVLDQLDSLQANIAKQNSEGFIKGKVNNLAAALGQNADVGTINAQLQAIVPNLARGVYGEVGVLTDNDIANYRKTLPNLTMPKDQNDAVLALTLKAVQKNLKNTLETAANSKMDVSRFVPQYQQVSTKINEINDRIGVTDLQVRDYANLNPSVKPMVEALIKEGRKGSEILQILGVEY